MSDSLYADANAPNGPGARLARAREENKISLEDMAKQLCLTKSCVKDIENDDYSHDIPFIFIRGYLRSYARLVHLNPDDIMTAFDDLGLSDARMELDKNIAHSPPLRINESNWHWLIYIVVGALLVLFYIWWHTQLHIESERFTLFPENDNQGQLLGHAQDNTQNQSPIKAEKNIAKDTAQQATTKQAPTSAKLNLAILGKCWVDIKDHMGKQLFIGLSRKGDELDLMGVPPFQILLGNPSVVRVRVNKKPIDLSAYESNHPAHIILEVPA